MDNLLPGTEVIARELRWEVVLTQKLGTQILYRLRGLDGAVQGKELDVLHPFEPIDAIRHEFAPEQAAPLSNWLVYHQAFLLSVVRYDVAAVGKFIVANSALPILLDDLSVQQLPHLSG